MVSYTFNKLDIPGSSDFKVDTCNSKLVRGIARHEQVNGAGRCTSKEENEIRVSLVASNFYLL